MEDLTNIMLHTHLMSLVHKYLSVRDIIVFYTTSISMIKQSHLPLYKGLILFEYPLFDYDATSWEHKIPNKRLNISDDILYYFINNNDDDLCFETNVEHSIFVYSTLKAQNFNDIVAYLGTLINIKAIMLYDWPIETRNNWEVNYLIFSSYDNFAKPYFHVKGYDKLFDFKNYFDEGKRDNKSQYLISMKKSLKILTGKIIKLDFPILLWFIPFTEIHLIKPFKSCKIANNSYVHKSDCKSHQICEILNWQQNHKI